MSIFIKENYKFHLLPVAGAPCFSDPACFNKVRSQAMSTSLLNLCLQLWQTQQQSSKIPSWYFSYYELLQQGFSFTQADALLKEKELKQLPENTFKEILNLSKHTNPDLFGLGLLELAKRQYTLTGPVVVSKILQIAMDFSIQVATSQSNALQEQVRDFSQKIAGLGSWQGNMHLQITRFWQDGFQLPAVDTLALALIFIPGGLFASLSRRWAPTLSVRAAQWLQLRSITKNLVYFTNSNFAKAVLLAGTHILNNGADSFRPDPAIMKEWFGDGNAWVTVPAGGLLFTGIALLAKRYAWVEVALHTIFSFSAAYHHADRMRLNQQLTMVGSDSNIEKKLREHSFDAALFLLVSGMAVQWKDARWVGTAVCAVDDVLPWIARVTRTVE